MTPVRGRRLAPALLLLLPLLAGCHERRKDAAVPPKESAESRERGLQAEHNAAARRAHVEREAITESAPEFEYRKAKIVGTDPRGCTWLESEGLVTAGEDETPNQARASAVNEARKTAMQDFLGVHITQRHMDFAQEGLGDQRQIIESVLRTTREGRILDEKVLNAGYRDLADCKNCRYGVTLRSCILPTPSYADKGFEIDLGLSRNRLVAGDAVTINVTPTRDCYVYIYDIWLDWKQTAMIVPNDRLPEVHLKAGQTWEYPNDELRRQGISKLQADLPAGYTVSAETVRVIATKHPLPKSVTDPSQGFLAIMSRLNAQRVDWAENSMAFTIFEK